MKVARLRVDFVLHGCRSLKDKRQRLSRIRDKFGRQTNVAVCESDFQDDLKRAQWAFVSCASSARIIEQHLADVESYVATSIDAEVVAMERDWLA